MTKRFHPFEPTRGARTKARASPPAAKPSLAARCLAAIPAVKTLALTLSLVFSAVVFLAILREAWPTSILIQPVAVPPAMVQQGFAPMVVAGRLKAALADIDRKASTGSARAPRGALPAEQADFQIPGQSFSLKTGIAYLKQLLGRPDINVDVDITEGVDGFAAQVRTNPSTRQLMRPLHFGLNADRDEMMRTIAETIMGGVKPLVLASYRTALEQARCAKPGATARDYSTALELYRSILNDASSADHQWALLGRCNIYYLLDQAQEVQQACGLAISLYPDFDRPYVIRAMSAMGSDPAAAGADFQRAVEKNPHNASAYYFLGQLLQKSGKFDSAAAKFAMAESIEPGHVAALRRWGDALAAAERWDEARAVYRRALLIAPDDELSRAGWNNAVRIPADPAIHVIRR